MEFWELLFFVDLVLMVTMLLWKISSVWKTVDATSRFTDQEKKDKHLLNWQFLILNFIAYGMAFFTYLTKVITENLLTPLMSLLTIIVILNTLFFIAEMFYILMWKADEVIQSHNTIQQRKDLKGTL